MSETALSTISSLPENKQESIKFAYLLSEEILSGNIDPLKADIRLKIIIDCFNEVRSRIKEMATKEAEKHGQKEFEFAGVKVLITGKTTYDYTGCYSKYDALKKSIKEMEKFLKNIPVGFVDSETGEEVLKPIVKYSPFLKIEFIK